MINYAASINQTENQNAETNVETELVKKDATENQENNINGSEKLDSQFKEILRRYESFNC